MNFIHKIFCAVSFIALMTPGTGQAAPTLLLIGPASPVAVGAAFSLALRVDEANDLYGYQLNLHYNPVLVSVESVGEGAFLPSVGASTFVPGTVDNTNGTITYLGNSLLGSLAGATGNGVLAEFIFRALSGGVVTIGIDNALLLDSSFNTFVPAMVDASATIVPTVAVSEPQTILILLLGMCGLLLFMRRRKF